MDIKLNLSDYGLECCDVCEHGLILPPPARAPVSLYVIRAIQYEKGYLVFCDCPAGQRYEAYLQKRLAEIRAQRDYVVGDYWRTVITDAEADTAMPEMAVA